MTEQVVTTLRGLEELEEISEISFFTRAENRKEGGREGGREGGGGGREGGREGGRRERAEEWHISVQSLYVKFSIRTANNT